MAEKLSPKLDARRMECGVIEGKHTFKTDVGVNVHIWQRDHAYIARG